MVIVGLSDGSDAGAAVLVNQDLVAVEAEERFDRSPDRGGFPWRALDQVLEEAGLRPSEVDEVAVAGQFSPPFFARRHPGLRRAGGSAFGRFADLGVFFQSVLRQTGLGALEADRAAEWLERQLEGRGFDLQRVTLTDIHRALAEAAYRTQPHDRAIVITLHPRGDGALLAVHEGSEGQLERTSIQHGSSSLHLHVRRCLEAIGFEPCRNAHRAWAVAAAGTPDPELVALLKKDFRAEGLRMAGRSSFADRTTLLTALRTAERPIAVASVLENLSDAVRAMVREHVSRSGCENVAVAGTLFDNPRLCASLLDLDEVRTLWVPPDPGQGLLPLGVALHLAGTAPRPLEGPGLGRQFTDVQIARALKVARLHALRPPEEADAVAAFLAEGHAVARFQGRGGFGRHGGGTRSVLVRADDPSAVEHAKNLLGLPLEQEPVCLWINNAKDGVVHGLEKCRDAARFGTVALQVDSVFAAHYPGVVSVDGRVLLQCVLGEHDPVLHRIILALQRRTGCGAIACLPLAWHAEPVVALPGDAVRVWERSGLRALLLGPFLVQHEV